MTAGRQGLSSHTMLRVIVVELFKALDLLGVKAWAESGAAIRIARHVGKQVPWGNDADVAALLCTGNMTFDNRKYFMNYELLSRLRGKWKMRPITEARYCLQYHITKLFNPGCDSLETIDLFFHQNSRDAPEVIIDGARRRHISYGACFSRDAPVPRAAA